jgi:pyruvate dehydrogenase E2 component (dihydrolipoamide acetyltransferase)
VRISPLAARLAHQKGIDLGEVEGSGPYGRIIKSDIDRAVRTPGPTAPTAGSETPAASLSGEAAKGEVTTVELSRIQQTIARRMAESKATTPHFYLHTEVDMTRAIEVRGAFEAAAAGGAAIPSLNDMVVKAVALALRHHPRANSTYRDGRIEQFSRVNVGVAVAAQDALIVPVITDADRQDLREISAETRRLADRVRSGEVTPPELAGGTFTITNLGMFGVRSFDPVIHGGQAAILAVGEATERPAVRDGQVVAAHLMDLSLACDHRILYGAEAAEFLAEIKANLEEPGLLA